MYVELYEQPARAARRAPGEAIPGGRGRALPPARDLESIMRGVLFAILAVLVLFAIGFVYLLTVAGGMDPGDEEVRIEIEDKFED